MLNVELPLFNSAAARSLRDRGMAIAASFPNDAWLVRARSTAEMIAATQGEVTIEDIYKKIGLPPTPNVAGSVFKGKRFRKVGYFQAERIESHARDIKRWVLND